MCALVMYLFNQTKKLQFLKNSLARHLKCQSDTEYQLKHYSLLIYSIVTHFYAYEANILVQTNNAYFYLMTIVYQIELHVTQWSKTKRTHTKIFI